MCLFINFTHFMAGIPAEILLHIPAGISRMSVLIEHQTRIALRVCLLKERPHLLFIYIKVFLLTQLFLNSLYHRCAIKRAYQLFSFDPFRLIILRP